MPGRHQETPIEFRPNLGPEHHATGGRIKPKELRRPPDWGGLSTWTLRNEQSNGVVSGRIALSPQVIAPQQWVEAGGHSGGASPEDASTPASGG